MKRSKKLSKYNFITLIPIIILIFRKFLFLNYYKIDNSKQLLYLYVRKKVLKQ